ncbi:DUF6868 family protein [uncultured Paraglaciecola sp.]|uniref:DUF6868 family protein n=1 Tax=uncultured Paraglaciecola sp. TaxID=1765024 RepID=UPI0030D9840F|tara:strand:+ start:5708 stop:5953 length:246 start_codon:yes stop_codon:yes gene_type:complete
MNNVIQLSEIFGWMSLINIGLLCAASLALIWMKDKIAIMHGRLFNVAPSELKILYMNYLAHYKLLIFVFNLVPYIVLKVVV